MNSKRILLTMISMLILVALVVPSFTVGAQDGKILRAVLSQGDVRSLDPNIATDNISNQVIISAFTTLIVQNEETFEIEAGMANEWSVSDDGLTYTFNLRDDVPWVVWDTDAGEVVQVTDDNGDVRIVNAHDFEYSFKRILNPETASEYAYLPADWIAGGGEFLAGEGDADGVQVTATDDFTLEVTVTQAVSFAPTIMTLWLLSALPQWSIEANGDFWTEVENYHAYGPFVMSDRSPEESLTMVKNPFYPGTEGRPVANLDGLEFTFLEQSAALANWEAGEIEFLKTVPSADIDRLQVEYPDNLVSNPQAGVYYYGFNTLKAPTDSAHMRRALSFAVDRQSIQDNVDKRGEVVAPFFSSESLAAAPTREEFPDLGIRFDPEAAQAELALYMEEMGFESVDDVPPLTLAYNTTERHAAIAEAVQQMWVDTLGIDVTLSTQEFAVYLDTLNEDPPNVYRLGWGADYPDAHNFLSDVLSADSGNNYTGYAGEEFNAILEAAALEPDLEVRQQMYARAEELVVEIDAAVVPFFWTANSALISDGVVATESRVSTDRFEKWDIQ